MNATWVLVFSFLVPNNTNFNQPVFMDHFTTKEKCEATLYYITKNYEEVGIKGEGYCWGESKTK